MKNKKVSYLIDEDTIELIQRADKATLVLKKEETGGIKIIDLKKWLQERENPQKKLLDELKSHFPALSEEFIKIVIAEYQRTNPREHVATQNVALYQAAEYQEVYQVLEELYPLLNGSNILADRIIVEDEK